jgi:hypothetical protein
MLDADANIDLRIRLSLARLLITLYAPPTPERRQAEAAIAEVLVRLTPLGASPDD